MDNSTVLIVEPSEQVCNVIERMLQGKATLLRAATIEQARLILSTKSVHTALVGSVVALVDNRGIGKPPTTLGLIREIRRAENRPRIIALSSSEQLREAMERAGCDSSVDKLRLDEVNLVDLLQLE